jgi:hypothetical protein
LKKAIELSRYCDQDVFIVILDKSKKRLVEFNSSNSFNLKNVGKILKPSEIKDYTYELYQNEDFSAL